MERVVAAAKVSGSVYWRSELRSNLGTPSDFIIYPYAAAISV